jgi:opacity protein-like surface antigen
LRSPVHVTAGGGLLTSGAYFTGPGDLALDNSDAFAGLLQVIVPVNRALSLVAGSAYSRPSWRLSGVPLLGSVGVEGASLWFADASVRGQVPLGRTPDAGPIAFAQAGVGLARYSLSTSLLGRAVDERATNFAVALGAGLGVPLTPRVGLEAMAKDYIVSFKSVHDLEPLGVEGRRAHTLVLALSARLAL